MLYHIRSITNKKTPGHGIINVICVSDIYDAVSLRNNRVMFFYDGQFNGYDINN